MLQKGISPGSSPEELRGGFIKNQPLLAHKIVEGWLSGQIIHLMGVGVQRQVL